MPLRAFIYKAHRASKKIGIKLTFNYSFNTVRLKLKSIV